MCTRRPPTAVPKDLMASAQRSRDYIGGELADPRLIDLAKICVAAIFGAADTDRESPDARRALRHLHFYPCQEPANSN